MMLIVSRPPAMRSIVAIWRASWGGHISPMRTAISRRIRRVSVRDRGGEGGGVQPECIAAWQQDVVEPARFGGEHDVAAMLPTRSRAADRGLAQKLVIVIAQRGEPRDFAAQGKRFLARGGQHGVPFGARPLSTLKASAASAMRSGVLRCRRSGSACAGCAMIHAYAAAVRDTPCLCPPPHRARPPPRCCHRCPMARRAARPPAATMP